MAQPSIHRFDEVGSTMDEARALAMAGAPHGTVVVAERQTAGRGRSGRSWMSRPGNLLATLVLRPGGGARRAPEIGFLVAVALAEAVDALAGAGCRLKWPNDLLRGGAKLAGILLERLDDGAVLAGVGVNVVHSPADTPYPTTNLRLLGCTASAEAILDALRRRVDAGWHDWQVHGFGPILARWRALGPALGETLRVRVGDEVVTGTFAGLGEDGTLLLDGAGGRRALVAGDVLL